MKKLLVVILVVAAFLGLCTMAQADYTDGDYTFTINGANATIIGYNGDGGAITLPSTLSDGENTFTVTGIGDYAFENCVSFTEVTIPEGITSIGLYAFSGCRLLTKIVMPSSISSVGEDAFSNCKKLSGVYITDLSAWLNINFGWVSESSNPLWQAHNLYLNNNLLTEIVIPEDIKAIKDGVFFGCSSLASITLHDNISTIGAYSFYGCTGLNSILLPKNLTRIGECAFGGCTNLKSVYINNISSWLKIAFGGSTFSCGYDLYSNSNLVTEVSIPDEISEVPNYIFSYCKSIRKIIIDHDITSIGNGAFYQCSNLDDINIPGSVKSIGSTAFSGCTSLKNIVIPDETESIGSSAFSGCTSLSSIKLPSKMIILSNELLYGCTNISEVIIPEGIIEIGWGAFRNCEKLTNVCFPKSLVEIDDFVFGWDSSVSRTIYYNGKVEDWKEISIGSNNTALNNSHVICEDSVSSIELSTDQTIIPFTGSEVTVDVSATVLPENASDKSFTWSCYYQPSWSTDWYQDTNYAAIDNGVVTIKKACKVKVEAKANDGSNIIGSIEISAVIPVNEIVLSTKQSLILLQEGEGTVTISKSIKPTNANNKNLIWTSSDESIATVEDGIVSFIREGDVTITATAADGYGASDSILLLGREEQEFDYTFVIQNESVTITDYKGNNSNVEIPATIYGFPVKAIGNGAFSGHGEIENIIIPFGVESIGNSAFSDCYNLSEITIPNSVINIGNNAFCWCDNLTNIVIPSSVTTIGNSVFSYCTNMAYVSLCNGLVNIGNYAFNNCRKVTTINLPQTVTSIGDYAFQGCTQLMSITIPNDIATIGQFTFSGCTNLTSITLPKSITTIDKKAFYQCYNLLVAYYNGTMAEWSAVAINESGNSCLTNARIICSDSEPLTYVEKIELDRSSLTLYVSDYEEYNYCELFHTTSPSTATITKVIWESSNPAVATVDSIGKVRAKSVGTAVITCKAVDGSGVSASATVQVKQINVYGITFNCDNDTVTYRGAEKTKICISASAKPNYASNRKLTWESSNPEIATIEEEYSWDYYYDKVVIFHSPGEVIITCRATDGSGITNSIKLSAITDQKCGKNATWNIENDTLTISGTGEMYDYDYQSGRPAPWHYMSYSKLVIEPGITTIGSNAFNIDSTFNQLKEVSIPSTVTSIGSYAFANCDEITEIAIPDSVTGIDGWAFGDCDGLANITIPGSVSCMAGAFAFCANLKSVIMLESKDNNSLSLYGTFYECTSLTTVALPDRIKYIDDYCFCHCNLKEIILPDNLKYIGYNTFLGNNNLEKVTLPHSLETIEEGAFYCCPNITKVIYKGTIKDWNKISINFGNDDLLNAEREYNYIPLESITISPTNAALYLGQDSDLNSLTPKITIEPSNATNQKLAWSSNDWNIAGVDENGTITASGEGTAIITCSSVENPDIKTTISITVSNIKVSSIDLTADAERVPLKKGTTSITLSATVLPENAAYKGVSWSSSNTDIATVKDGTVYFNDAGIVTITCTAKDGSGTSASIDLEAYHTGLVEYIILEADQKSVPFVDEQGTIQLTATVLPSTAIDPSLNWASSDTNIATVTDGVVNFISTGTVTITATAKDGSGVSDSIELSAVPIKVENIILKADQKTVQYIEGKTSIVVSATVLPVKATDSSIEWTSSDTNIATVTDGVVNFISTGTVTITATAKDGSGVSDSIELSAVPIKVENIILKADQKTVQYIEGKTSIVVSATVLPVKATDSSIEWTSSDTNIATVTDGVVNFISTGTVTITATAKDGSGVSGSIELSAVPIKVENIILKADQKTVQYIEGKTSIVVSATVLPVKATDSSIEWASSDTNIATVTDGVVSFISTGTVAITATAKDGSGVSDSIVLSAVPIKVENIVLKADQKTVQYIEGKTSIMVSATVLPAKATDSSIEWVSSDTNIATVTDGVVSFISTGTVTITAIAKDGSGVSDSIVLSAVPVKVENIILKADQKTVQYIEGKTSIVVSATVLPVKATDSSIEWASSDTNIATVTDGVVSFISTGTVTITATAKDGSGVSDSIELSAVPIKVENIILKADQKTVQYIEGKTSIVVSATVLPVKATDSSIEWTSSDTNIATVTDGVVSFISTGTVTVTATAKDGSGVSDSIELSAVSIKVESIILKADQTNVVIKSGKAVINISASVWPKNASNTSVEWTSSNNNIATVENGIVSFTEAGTVNITATAKDGSGVSDTIELSAIDIPVEYIALTADANTVKLIDGAGIIQVSANVLPKNATNPSLEWSSSDSSVATVTEGTVSFTNAGSVTITAKAKDGSGIFGEIRLSATEDKLIEEIILSAASTEVEYSKNNTYITVNWTVLPKDATNTVLAWSSSDPSVATVDVNGKVAFKTAGSVIITCAATDGSDVKSTITLKATESKLVTSITLKADKTKATLVNKKATITITATVKPNDAKNKAITWASNNTSVATVKNGVVTFKKVGTVTITATAADGGGAKKAIKLTAVQPVTSIKLKADKTKVTLSNGKATVKVTATIKPTDATDKTVTWATSDKKIATVKNGKVYFKKAGTVTITCTASDGSKVKATIKLTASEPLITAFNLYVKGSEDPLKIVTDKSKAQTAITLKKGKTANLIADNFEPDGVSDKTLVWKSLSTKIVTVTDGKLKGVAKGTAVIQVSPKNNPKLVYYFKVKVK